MTRFLSATRNNEPVKVRGTDETAWIQEGHKGSDYRLFCGAEGHDCRVLTLATYRRARIAALASEADGHEPALFARVYPSIPAQLTRPQLELRLDFTSREPRAFPCAPVVPIPATISRARKRRLREGSLTGIRGWP